MRSLPFSVLLLLACATVPPAAPTGGATPAPPAPSGPPLSLALERPGPGTPASPAPLFTALEKELSRNVDGLKAKADPKPYFVAYQATDTTWAHVAASFGALAASESGRRRSADVEVRVGDFALDNTHPLRSGGLFSSLNFGQSVTLPVDDDAAAIRTALWRATDAAYKKASERFATAKAERQVKAAEEDASDDFSREAPSRYLETPPALGFDRAAWDRRIRDLSAEFRRIPEVHESLVQLDTSALARYFVSSEGTVVQAGAGVARLTVQATTRADDGMDLSRVETLDAVSPARLPDDDLVRRKIKTVADDLLALRTAPLAEPYLGPTLLDGRAAAVFFHEIFGHRVEGHRQKREDEGQTFARKAGEHVMPDFVTVFDDPTIGTLNGVDLNGFYRYDDEGVPAQRALLVERGILKGFLMSRSPTRGFNRSNGHGRRQEGFAVVARQGNLVVQPERTVPAAELKGRLLAEVKRQGKPYGLRFREVTGGFTNTDRRSFQAFKVMPVMVYRVWPDGREELMRGADIEGTPLTVLSKILAAGDDPQVFNGYCGADSGIVPVSAVSPSLLVGQMEIVRREKGQQRPPILPPPPLERPHALRGGR